MSPNTIGIVGYGDFGRFLAELAHTHVPEMRVRIFSRRMTPDNETFFSLEDTCASDVVIVVTSIHEFEETLEKILPLLTPHSIVVEVNTVKVHPVSVLKKNKDRISYIATHPMFGPYSYTKQGNSLEGLRVALTDHNLTSEIYSGIQNFLTSLNLRVIELSAEEHDRLLAETLFLTHYLAQSVVAGEFVRTTIDTLSFGYLMDAVESVKNDTELFKDVYRFNPYCKDIITRINEAEQKTLRLLEGEGD